MTQIVDPAKNLKAILDDIAMAAQTVDRDPCMVHLVAVSKVHDETCIRPVLEAGQRVFGENRVQESMGKWPQLREDFNDIELHLIGPLQSNKVKEAVATFDVIESVDRSKIARALAKEFERTDRHLGCYIQVNTGEEPQKAGVHPEDVDAFILMCKQELGMNILGLMCIPPVDEEPAMHFALLADIADRNGLSGLSMGMSSDYETAIKLGATHVRVGTSIFGARPKPQA